MMAQQSPFGLLTMQWPLPYEKVKLVSSQQPMEMRVNVTVGEHRTLGRFNMVDLVPFCNITGSVPMPIASKVELLATQIFLGL
jgi:hypothetical protein